MGDGRWSIFGLSPRWETGDALKIISSPSLRWERERAITNRGDGRWGLSWQSLWWEMGDGYIYSTFKVRYGKRNRILKVYLCALPEKIILTSCMAYQCKWAKSFQVIDIVDIDLSLCSKSKILSITFFSITSFAQIFDWFLLVSINSSYF